MVSITIDDSRTAQLRSISAATLIESRSPLATFSISDASQPQTSGRIFAYRPSFADSHGSNVGVLLFGLRTVFPCIGATANPKPICSIFTHNNGGFHGGQPFVEASFRRFLPGNLPVYGFGVEGCPELTPECFPSGQEVAIVCYLPRELCGDGPGPWTHTKFNDNIISWTSMIYNKFKVHTCVYVIFESHIVKILDMSHMTWKMC